MTTPPPAEERSDDQPSTKANKCHNCFAEFQWTSTIHDGDEFCCSGCVEGGPCNCTYDGSTEPVDQSLGPTAAFSDEPAGVEVSAEQSAHREVLLEAIGELPSELQKIARLRVVDSAPIEVLAEQANIEPSEAAAKLHQAQVVLERTVGAGFTIEYIAESVRSTASVVAPQSDTNASTQAETSITVSEPSVESDFSAAIRGPLEALTAPLLGAHGTTHGTNGETAKAQNTIREALRDASAIFRLAAERLGDDSTEHPLRRLLADETTDEIRIVADGLTEPGMYLVALDGLKSTKWARIESKEDMRTVFAVESTKSSALIREVMALGHPFRPLKLVVSDNEVRISLPAEASISTAKSAETQAQVKTRPVFELGADAFFGARHFVTMGGVQGPPHHHSFRVEALMDAAAQDSDGVVIGFGEARKLVEGIVLDYNESLLNTIPPFTEIQPTSENIAKVIFERLKERLDVESIRLKQVRVWESPTNSASYSDAVLAI